MMDKPTLRIFPSAQALAAAAAQQFTETVSAAIRLRGRAYVALCGGSTPQALYALLAQPPYLESVPWDKIHFFWGDERCVPPDDLDSNYGQARQMLLARVPAPSVNIHRVLGEMPLQGAAEDYVKQLQKQASSGARWPRFDLVLLGMGADGHIASLFPGQVHPAEAGSPVIAVTASYQGRPANRVTLTPLVFNAAENVLFVVTGASKAAMLAAVLQGVHDPLQFPAQRIQPLAGSLTWFVDAAAAELIKKEI
jgi:6-phosphogluconolactonase